MRLNQANAILRVPPDVEEEKSELIARMERAGYELYAERPGTYTSGIPCVEVHFRLPNETGPTALERDRA
jgi:hypothetical protein